MRVAACCCAEFVDSARQASGVEPLTWPPLTNATFDPHVLRGQDLLYFDLHGAKAQPVWLDDHGQVAITADQIRSVNLDGATVVALNCFLADQNSPMMDALLTSAGLVIGGDGENFSPPSGRLYGAGLLAEWIRRLMGLGLSPLKALQWAKVRVRLALAQAQLLNQHQVTQANWDTLNFRAYVKKN